MTVGISVTITQRVWRGWADPGLPVGVWLGQASVVGDASGGSAFVNFDFAFEGGTVSGRFYNLEQLTTHHNDDAAAGGSLAALNWDGSDTDRIWSISYVNDGISNAGMASAGFAPGGMPIFLGVPRGNTVFSTSILVQIPNVLNRTLFATVQGYIWEPRSITVNGGLRRPAEALYG